MRSKAHKPKPDHPWITHDRLAILRHRERKAMRTSRLEIKDASVLVQFENEVILNRKEQPHE